ncbi:hypothetical protein NEOLEDRAFT_1141737 [Neolentinus lepideus HHB14362 ss-1]|uniref:Uncharacterized protein n=1 Tax=Neolentinus lepideus HHB14362 ss-1 TaxID=1314782 RepID=A0A165NGT8_9AGAM|nr:hypothetical protein NEOLEDRAFT_1141737 [Neolentinus lepideus HHB14362 ss-1]
MFTFLGCDSRRPPSPSLDKPLMIGQMQGKFQLAVVGGGVGHCVHEVSVFSWWCL